MKMVWNEYVAEEFLSRFLPVAKSKLVDSIDKIKMKPPFVLKIVSNDALHKTEIGGVKIVRNYWELEKKFKDLTNTVKKNRLRMKGILVQEFISGQELIIGIKKDMAFGYIILLGVGGIFAEIFEDISVRKCPINLIDAGEMIEELKSSKIFHDFRGRKLDIIFLKNFLVKFSKLDFKKERIEQFDLNPFILGEKCGKIVDAKAILYHKNLKNFAL